jgi:tetratricopeptide (TPR) repeat protein
MKRVRMLVLLAGLLALPVCAADKMLGSALGASAARLATEGKIEKARELCYKALANDEDAAEALYELGKIFEKEGKLASAADFLFRAVQQLGKDEAANPAFSGKRLDAERRVKALNPYATRYASILADYTQDLNTITKKVQDSLTLDEACDRADVLKLRTVVPPDKGPKFERAAKAPDKTAGSGANGDELDKSAVTRRIRRDDVQTVVPPDVERALKANGWTTITGVWKKKADNVYEVTDGKLETSKLNGAIQVIVHKGGTGNVRAFVRNYLKENEGYSDNWGIGFGIQIEGTSAKIYFPYGYSNNRFDSHVDRTEELSPASPKNKVMVMVQEGLLQYTVNDKQVRRGNYQISKNGPFMIQVEGTMTIEDPKAAGQ